MRYYCRNCATLTWDRRDAKDIVAGQSVKCLDCGGICDPTPGTVATVTAIRRADMASRAYLNEPCPVCGERNTWGDGGHREGGCHDCGRTVLPGIRVAGPPEVYDRDGNRID